MSKKIDAFNTVAGFYDDWYAHPQGKQVFEAERDAVENMLPIAGIGVEIGAGTGVFAESLTTEQRTVLCLDPSVEMLRKAKKRGLPCILGYGDHQPIRRDLLDFGYMITVLEFLNNPVATFTEFKDNAKKIAALSVLFINSESSWGTLYHDIGEKGDTVFQHARLYTCKEVEKLLESAGYRVVDIKGTLNSEPTSPVIDRRLVESSNQSGVLVIKAA